MRSLDELKEKLSSHERVSFIYLDDDEHRGYIAWACGTGGNVEVLYIEVGKALQGTSHFLYRLMVERMLDDKTEPYHSVYGFRLAGNKAAEALYDSLGWNQVEIGQSIYRGDGVVLMWTTFADLRKVVGLAGDN